MDISVSYQSQGILLIYGKPDQIKTVLGLLPPVLNAIAVNSEDDSIGELSRTRTKDKTDIQGSVHRSVPGTVMQVRGYLGHFQASVAGPQGLLDLGPLSPRHDGVFDLVMDLYEHPLIETEVPPLGYVRTYGNADQHYLERKIERLARLVGTINKPRYFSFDSSRCAHNYQGITGCTECLDTCPADAIHEQNNAININPWLCRGCGSCTLSCPTGAIEYARPIPKSTLETIAELLKKPTHAAYHPVLAIYADPAIRPEIPGQTPSLKVNAIGSLGMELWMAALALGASRVLIIRSGLLPDKTEQVLEQQIALARQLLKSIGEAPERIRLVNRESQPDWEGLPNAWIPIDPHELLKQEGKRRLLTRSFTHIANNPDKTVRFASTLSFDRFMPFGTVEIDQSRCTLCLSCTQLCPTAALCSKESHEGKQGGLVFSEADCVQCNLCVQACPENALRLQHCFNPNELIKSTEKILMDAPEMYHCIECGQPFAPRSLVESSMKHVADHPMFQEKGKRLLQMCPTCRQKSTLLNDKKIGDSNYVM